jgi:crossover junction endodeoxyribonuclease RusA
VKTYKGRMPFPPSLNGAYRNVQGVGRVKTKEYKVWEKVADSYAFLTPRPRFDGPVRVEYVFHKPDNRRRDLGNLEKLCSDRLTAWGLWGDDSQIHHLTLRWAEPEEVSVGEVSVTVSEL